MEELSRKNEAFIRPSPAGRSLGGVANRTRETILVTESAGFDVILVETVGVGQSEYEAHSMTDLFLVLIQPGGGDELQGIKKGILEVADFIVINKADGEAERLANQSVVHYKSAMGYLNHQGFWTPEVLSVSSLEQRGIEALWDRIGAYCEAGTEAIPERRIGQSSQWFERLLSEGIANHLDKNETWVDFYKAQKEHVTLGRVSPTQAAISCIDWLKNNL
jgi:LAO/AO transport system kinase